jgi:hypothetical protein
MATIRIPTFHYLLPTHLNRFEGFLDDRPQKTAGVQNAELYPENRSKGTPKTPTLLQWRRQLFGVATYPLRKTI